MNVAIKKIEITDKAETILLALGEFTMLTDWSEASDYNDVLEFTNMSVSDFSAISKALADLGMIRLNDGDTIALTFFGNEHLNYILTKDN